MARLVLGIGVSHSPLLTFGVDTWISRSPEDRNRKLNLSDGRTVSYDELSGMTGNRYEKQAQKPHLAEQCARCQAGLDRLADALAEAAPDLVMITGDDQGELFSLANMPALSIFYGKSVVTHPWGGEMPGWKKQAAIGYGMDAVHTYPAAPDEALAVIKGLIRRGVDVGAAADVVDPLKAGFGHAFGFVAERLLRGRSTPILPLLLNTYFPPNVPSAARCYEIGGKLRQTLEELGDLKIALIASGGLSHFVTDEELDRGVLTAIQNRDARHLSSIPPEALRSGSSEILNWILAAGALEGLTADWYDYLPVYRTPAGTGIGMGFMTWR